MNNHALSITATRNLVLLSAALVVQCLLLVFLWFKPSANDAVRSEPLLAVAKDTVERVVISAEQPLVLERKADGWFMGELPADPAKVAALLDKLASLQTAWPTATTEAAATRFEVAAEKFQRKVEVHAQNGDPSTLYFGTSPSFNRTHVRRADDQDIYALAVNVQDISAATNAWLQTNLLQPTGELQRIVSAGVTIEKVADKWQIKTAGADTANAPEAPVVEQKEESQFKPESLVTALTQLTVMDVADSKTELDTLADKQQFTLEVVTSDAQFTYQFMQLNDQYYVQRSDLNTVFRIAKAPYDELAKLAGFAQSEAQS